MPTRSTIVTLSVLCLLAASKGYLFPQPKAVLKPVDPLVFIDETLKLQCRLTDRTIQASSHDMFFEIASHYVSPSWTVLLENVTVVDNTTISADLNITDDFSNTTTVFCKYKRMNQSVELRSGYIHVEKPIRNITRFSAVYYYFGNMELSWSLGERYLSDTNINVTVDWSANVPPNQQGASCMTETRESCILKPTGQDIIFMRINVTYTKYTRPSAGFLQPLYNTRATSVIQMSVHDYMKTQPPGNLHDIDRNSTCAKLTWDNPLYFKSSREAQQYEVTITKKDDRSNNITEHGVRRWGQDYITVCSFSPFTTHVVSVRLRARDVNPWSDPASTEVTTDEDEPLTGPPLNSTSYHLDDCVDNEMSVVVYWNDPLKSSLRGELTKFEVVVNNVSDSLRKGLNYYKTKLDCGAEHDVLVYSVNKAGRSLSPSDISIPKKSAEIPALNDVTVRMEEVQETSDTDKSVNVTVAWDPGPLAERNVTLVLYMCQESSDPYTCLNDFSTREISVGQREVLLNDLEESVSLFGYALKDDQGHKRGIEWINCVYRAKQTPNRPVPVTVNAGREANTLDISWAAARCDRKTKVLILRYHLFICGQLIQNYKICPNTTVNSSRSSYIAEDLVGGSTYNVYIEAESPGGLSPPSKPTAGVPGVSDSNSANTLGIIMGVLSVLIVAGSLMYLARKCKHSKKKITSLTVNKCHILEYAENLQPQPSEESGIYVDKSQEFTVDIPLEKPLVPPTLSSKRGIDLAHQIFSQYTHPVDTSHEMAYDTEVDNTKDHIPRTATCIPTTNPQLPCLLDVVDDLETPHLPGQEHEYLHSGSANPYVKIANAYFSSGSVASTVAVDEGYNSPEADMEKPVFSADTSRTMPAGRPASPGCKNGFVPPLSPSSQIVFTCTFVSSQAEKILPEPNLSVIPPQSQRTSQEPGFIINSPHFQIIPETNLSMKSPQSQISETHLPMKSPQSQISETHLPKKSPQSQISETNVSTISPQSQKMLSRASISPMSQQPLDKHRATGRSPKPIVTTNSSIIHVYNVSNPSQHELQPAVNFLDSNPTVNSSDSNSSTISFPCSKNIPEYQAYFISDTNLLARPQVELCNESNGTSADSTEVCDFTENSDLYRGDNSNQQMVSGYVTCAIDGAMNFKTMETVSEHESTGSGNVFSRYKPNCHTSQNLAIPERSLSVNSGYKSLEFIENSATVGLISEGGLGTHGEDFDDQGGFVGQGGFDGQGRFVGQGGLDAQGGFGTCKENFGYQGSLPDCMLNIDGAGTDDLDIYVTCAIDGEIKSEKVDSDLEHEPAASLDRFSDYTPNCQTSMNTKDVFSEYESDECVSPNSSCGEIGQMPAAVATDEDSASGGYRSLSFLEHSHGLDFGDPGEFGCKKVGCVQQGGFGIQKEDCGRQAGCAIHTVDFGHLSELKMLNETFGHQGELKMLNETFDHQGELKMLNDTFDHQGELKMLNETFGHQGELKMLNETFDHQGELKMLNETFDHQGELKMLNETFDHQGELKMLNETFDHQGELKMLNETFDHQGELKMLNETFVNGGCLPVEENNQDVTGEVDGQTFDYVRQHFTDKDLNLGVDSFMLKPALLGNNLLKQTEVLPEQSTSKNSSIERNDLDNTSADATDEHSIYEGGYVSHFQLSTQAPGDSRQDPPGDSRQAPPGDSTQAPPSNSTQAPPGDSTQAPPGDSTQDPPGDSTPAPPGNSTQAPPGDSTQAPPGDSTQAPPGNSTQAPPGDSRQVPLDNSTQAPPGDSHSYAILDTGCRQQTENSSQISESPDIESSHTDNDFGYVSVNYLAGGVIL